MSQTTDRVMLDIETLGTKPGAAVLSIGAVRFNIEGDIWDEFHHSIDLESATDAGLTIDGDTLNWWLEQDTNVKDVLTGGDDLEYVLGVFSEYYADADEVWAYSPSFDCDVLGEAYKTLGMEPPWEYWQERCCRTIAALPTAPDLEREDDENAHNALDDARHQARIVSLALSTMQEPTHV